MRSMSCGSSEGKSAHPKDPAAAVLQPLERGVAVSRISESAGISKAAIYRYKED